jgi:hypothetical protein
MRAGRRFVAAGFFGGLLAGALAWSYHIEKCRRDLFSPSLVRRFAALGYLGGQASVETARLLTEYVRWETRPVLRRRAERLLRRMEAHLG